MIVFINELLTLLLLVVVGEVPVLVEGRDVFDVTVDDDWGLDLPVLFGLVV